MAPTTLKIKTTMLQKGDTFEGLAVRWGFTRSLLTKVAHCERGNGEEAKRAQKRLARYVGSTVASLFPESTEQPQSKVA